MYKVRATSKHTIFVNDIDVILYDVVYVNIKKSVFENSKDIQTLINSKKIEYTSFSDQSDIENFGNTSLNDNTISLSETWSSSKIKLEIDNVKPNVDVSAILTELSTSIKNDFYNKTEIDNINNGLSTAILNDVKSNYYSKKEIDTINLNVNSSISDLSTNFNNYYLKNEVDTIITSNVKLINDNITNLKNSTDASISDLNTKINDLKNNVYTKNDIYTKVEVDTLNTNNLNSILSTLTNYYKKNETDNLLSSKANLVDVYSKSEANSTFASLTYTNNTFATKAEVDHTHPELHTHDNKDILDLFSFNNELQYNGKFITGLINDAITSNINTFSSSLITNLLNSKSDINHVHSELHIHDNKDVLDLLDVADGKLRYAGVDVSSANLIDDSKIDLSLTWSSKFIDDQLANKAYIGHVHDNYLFANRNTLLKISEVNGKIYYDGNNLDGIKTIKVGSNIITNSAFEIKEGQNIKLDVLNNTITISAINLEGGTSMPSINYLSNTFNDIIAGSDQTITITDGSLGYMPVSVYKYLDSKWKQCLLNTEYEIIYIDDLNLNVKFLIDGTFKVVYGMTLANSNGDIVLDGGEF